jgi:hypothetical protein
MNVFEVPNGPCSKPYILNMIVFKQTRSCLLEHGRCLNFKTCHVQFEHRRFQVNMDVFNLYMDVLKRDHVNMCMFKCNLTMFNFENTPCLRFEHDRVVLPPYRV